MFHADCATWGAGTRKRLCLDLLFVIGMLAGSGSVSSPAGRFSCHRCVEPSLFSCRFLVGGVTGWWAVDAAGNNLPTSFTLEGSTLTQHVDLNAATAFPVVADPSYDSYKKLNGAEKSFCRWPSRWSICNTAREDGGKALGTAESLFSTSLHNGKGDAFRHCYWSSLMTIHMGAATAAGFGDRHEEVDGNPWIEREMD